MESSISQKQTAFQPIIDVPPVGGVFDSGPLSLLRQWVRSVWVTGALYVGTIRMEV